MREVRSPSILLFIRPGAYGQEYILNVSGSTNNIDINYFPPKSHKSMLHQAYDKKSLRVPAIKGSPYIFVDKHIY